LSSSSGASKTKTRELPLRRLPHKSKKRKKWLRKLGSPQNAPMHSLKTAITLRRKLQQLSRFKPMQSSPKKCKSRMLRVQLRGKLQLRIRRARLASTDASWLRHASKPSARRKISPSKSQISQPLQQSSLRKLWQLRSLRGSRIQPRLPDKKLAKRRSYRTKKICSKRSRARSWQPSYRQKRRRLKRGCILIASLKDSNS